VGLLTERVVLVSGGGQGVGAGIARAAAREGGAVVLTGRHPGIGEALAAGLRSGGAEALFVRADVADVASAQASAAAAIERFGRVDGLVNAAGETARGARAPVRPHPDQRPGHRRLLVEQDTRPGDYPHADGVRDNVLIYGERIRGLLGEAAPLPHSQKYRPGYVAYHSPEFIEYFGAHYVQLPLAKGDATFFNPALFHAAGTNRSAGIKRMANLLQVSSAFGRAMESVDTTANCLAVFGALKALKARGGEGALRNLITVVAEGCPFPTNLDHDQPIGGMAPPTQADLLGRAVAEDWDDTRLRTELTAQQQRRRTA
jgi:short chain dehydrogenase/Phytanoyl-CoA dioxygenase (PhyH)